MLLISVLALLLAFVLYCCKVYTRFSRNGVRNFTPIPILGDMARLTFQKEHFCDVTDRLYKSFPGEKFVGSFHYVRPVVFIRDLELIKQVTVKDFEHFADHAIFADEKIDPFIGRNLFALKGQEWKDMRATISPAFTSSKMRVMLPFMTEAGDHMIYRIKKIIRESNKDYYDVDFKDLTNRYSHDVIASCVLGLRMNSQNEADAQFFETAKAASELTFKQGLKIFAFQSFPTLMKMFKAKLYTEKTENYFNELVTQIIRERKTKNIHRSDIIQLLMKARTGNLTHDDDESLAADAALAPEEESSIEKNGNSRVWADEDVISQAVNFFTSGITAMSQEMTFLAHELAFNPDVQEKLVQEIRENDKKNGGKIDYTSIHEMTYMDMVVSEMLRLWTTGGSLDRVCTKDYNLGKPNDKATEDFIIHKGEGVWIPFWSLHRDPQFFPNPTKFDPERFSEENRHKIQPFTYCPFGLGPRNCVASRFALYELKVMIYQLLRHVELSPSDKTIWSPDVSPSATFHLLQNGGYLIRLRIRE